MLVLMKLHEHSGGALDASFLYSAASDTLDHADRSTRSPDRNLCFLLVSGQVRDEGLVP